MVSERGGRTEIDITVKEIEGEGGRGTWRMGEGG